MATPVRKRVRLQEIADEAGVSVSTVSMSLADHPNIRGATKERIREISSQLGYRPVRRTTAARVRSPESPAGRFGLMLIGCRMDDEQSIAILHALALKANDFGARIEIQAVEDVSDTPKVIEQTVRYASGLDGLILTGLVDQQLLQAIDAAKIPNVTLGHAMDSRGVRHQLQVGHNVSSDDVAMGAAATTFLIDRGHTRIGFITERLLPGLWASRWLRGYHMVLFEHKIKPEAKLVHVSNKVFGGGDEAAEAMVNLAAKPTAFIVPDARTAASFISGMERRGFKIRPDNIVVSGEERLLAQYGLEHLPWIGYMLDLVAAVTLRQLRQIIQEPFPCATELLVPFATRNLGEPG